MVYFSSGDNNVYALNASTGAKLWTYATGAIALLSSPAVANGVVYVGSDEKGQGDGGICYSNCGSVYALNASTVVSNILCKRRFWFGVWKYSAAVEAVRMWEACFAFHICIA